MKVWLGLLIGMSLSASDLVLVGNGASEQQLSLLSQKYQQNLIVTGEKVYLAPSACRIERYFGGSSQGELKLIQAPSQTEKIAMTQEVFNAKESTQIVQKIEQDKSVAIAEAKVSRAFLEDKEGRGFGGASQIPLDFSFEKVQLLNETAVVANSAPVEKKALPTPQCAMMSDGSGYKINSVSPVYLYRNGVMETVADHIVRYE